MNSKIWSNLSKNYGADKVIAVLTAVGMVFSTVVLPVPLIASDTDYVFPNTVVNDTEVGSRSWGNPSNAKDDNGEYSETQPLNNGQKESNYLKASGFDFSSIPEGSTINGIEVVIERKGDLPGVISDNEIRISNGIDSSENKALGELWTDTDLEVSYGGSSDTWGDTVSLGDLKSGDFFVLLSAKWNQTQGNPAGEAMVNYIKVLVDFTEVEPDPTDADLSITKTVSTSTVAVGDQFTYTIEVTNNGPATSTEIVVTDELNACLDFISANPDEYSNDEWQVSDLGNGDSASLEITVELNDSCQVDDEIENTASVASDEDLNSENDSASTTITVIEASGNGGGDPQDPVSQITAPTENEVVSGTTTLEAFYVDENEDGDDAVQWAVKTGVCGEETDAVFGNVDNRDDDYEWNFANFSSDFDTTQVEDGDYCFVFNPTEDGDDEDQRLTRNFTIQNEVVVDPIVASILGFKWHDLDFDGLWTTLIEEDTELEVEAEYEPVVEGWTIKATPIDGEGGVATTTTHGEEKSTTTDSDGKYEFGFTAEEFGWWRISEESQAGWVQTSTTTPHFDIEIDAEGEITGEIGGEDLNFGNYELLVISNESVENAEETQATITWDTNNPGTSRVVYGTTSQAELGDAPNYGYASSTDITDEDPKVLNHSVLIEGLTPGITYFYRVISSASPEAVGGENSFVAFQQSSGGGGGGSSSSGGSSGGGGGSSSSSGGSGNSGGGTANTGGSTETPQVILYEIMPPEYYENPETFGQLPAGEPAVVALGEQVAEEIDETGGISTTTDEEGDVVVTNIDEDDTGLLAATIFGIPEGIAKTLFWIVLLLIQAYIIYKAWQKYKERKDQQV